MVDKLLNDLRSALVHLAADEQDQDKQEDRLVSVLRIVRFGFDLARTPRPVSVGLSLDFAKEGAVSVLVLQQDQY